MPQHYVHEIVNHAAVQYVDGNVHTNGMENFWSLLKRGLGGTYVSVEPFHLFRYIDEQAFRFNNRKHEDGEVVSDYARFKRALNQVVGRRLTYSQLIGKEGRNGNFLRWGLSARGAASGSPLRPALRIESRLLVILRFAALHLVARNSEHATKQRLERAVFGRRFQFFHVCTPSYLVFPHLEVKSSAQIYAELRA